MSTSEAPPRRDRVAEVGRLTGFTPTTLRFHENRGVHARPERTASGSRTYDDRDVERLRLIARAKDLGCTLEEQTAVASALEATASSLATRAVDGPCDDGCGGTTQALDEVDDACSLGGGAMQQRIGERQAVVAGEGAPLAEIRRLAVAEHDRCRFFASAITVDGRRFALEVTAPANGQLLLDAVFGSRT